MQTGRPAQPLTISPPPRCTLWPSAARTRRLSLAQRELALSLAQREPSHRKVCAATRGRATLEETYFTGEWKTLAEQGQLGVLEYR